MIRTIVATAVGAALGVFVAAIAIDAASAQQMDGKHCQWAYKKLQQHRTGGYCFEQGDGDQKPNTEGKGEHSIRDRVTDAVGGLFD